MYNMMKKRLLIAGAAFMAFGHAGAMAQSIDEIVVTAQKKEQNIQEVGISITAMPGDTIEALGFSTTPDIVAQVPGLNVGTPVGEGNNPAFSLRGVGLNDFNDNSEGPIAVYIDEVYQAALPGLTFNLFDTERVEVLRGPQGTLYGRNATGGLIHFISKTPTDDVDGYSTVEMGNYNTLNFSGAIGGSLGQGARGRLSVSSLNNDGYASNRIGPDSNQAGSVAVRGQIEFDLAPETTLLLKAEHADSDVAAPYYQHEGTTDATGADALPFCPQQSGTYDVYCYADNDGDNFDGEYNTQGRLEIEKEAFTATLKTPAGMGIELTNVAHYSETVKAHQEDTDMGPNNGLDARFGSTTTVISDELRLAGEGDNYSWVVGAFYLDTEVEGSLDIDVNHRRDFLSFLDRLAEEAGGFGVSIATLPDPDFPFGAPGTGGLSGANPNIDLTLDVFAAGDTDATLLPFIRYDASYTQDTTSTAIFGQFDYEITPQLKLTAGARYTEEERELEYVNLANADAAFNNFVTGIIGVPDFFRFTSEALAGGPAYNIIEDDNVSGKVVLDYQVNDDLLVFVSANQGYKAGGFNAGLLDFTDGVGVEDVPYDAEELLSYETGFKYDFPSGNYRVNASAFIYDYTDYQALTFRGLSQFITNSDAEFTGAEVELVGTPMEDLYFQIGASLLDAEIDQVSVDGVVSEGVSPVLAPEFTINGLVRYEQNVGRGAVAYQLSFNHQDDHYFDITNKELSKEEAYTLLDGRVSYEVDNWEFAIYGQNLTDEEYRVYTFDFSGPAGFNQQFYGKPRWFGATVTYRH